MSTNNRYDNNKGLSVVSKKEEHPAKQCETQNQTVLTKEDFSLNDSAIKHFSR
ncbi:MULTISPECIES: hypothetical protein [Priestia]|jgi:hypothetical protein|uniref:hypothetical protein n=1 Tax=Priestia TaxID=2800373 RepID=UPI0004045999|nr:MULTISPECIES: hypothetical protein [Priestia]MBZ5480111.1 hypothetical protein [Bacillus sp. T_4]MBU8586099.1 hypothetical protein [Priestia megaterium]MDN3230036.1 hypothetical protein [Priestia megaterium]MDP9723814.1 hypothetical protein [Priestia aryabhattai]MED4617570.1 hypothetical protein [Priestia megaterium]